MRVEAFTRDVRSQACRQHTRSPTFLSRAAPSCKDTVHVFLGKPRKERTNAGIGAHWLSLSILTTVSMAADVIRRTGGKNINRINGWGNRMFLYVLLFLKPICEFIILMYR